MLHKSSNLIVGSTLVCRRYVRSMIKSIQRTTVGPRMAGRVKTFIGHVGRGIDIHVSQSGGTNDTSSDGSSLLVGVLMINDEYCCCDVLKSITYTSETRLGWSKTSLFKTRMWGVNLQYLWSDFSACFIYLLRQLLNRTSSSLRSNSREHISNLKTE